jgi:putative ABC transport system substrate-binding protein
MSQESRSISRRLFGKVFAGFAVGSRDPAFAQTSKAIRRIAVLDSGMPDPPDGLWEQAAPLRALGWFEGRNLQVERRYDNGRRELLQPLAEELVRSKAEIIVTAGTDATLAVKRATTTIPIVFVSYDAVLLGLVSSLARPGGNLTGYSVSGPEVTAKRLSMLKELLPTMQRVGVFWEAPNGAFGHVLEQFRSVCQSLGLAPVIAEYNSTSEPSHLIEELVQRRAEAVMLFANSFTLDHLSAIVDSATEHRVPTMGDPADVMVRDAGALIAYSSTAAEQYQVRAEYIDRILRGASPGDLPVRQPTRFELMINLRTARVLGVAVPKELLLRADALIQ